MSNTKHHNSVISEELANRRLDWALARLFPELTRQMIQNFIKQACVTVDGEVSTNVRKMTKTGMHIEILAPQLQQTKAEPEAIPLAVVYEDQDLIIINKPVGMVVHPGAGNTEHTLLNALLHHDKLLSELPRAGIIHRLDKDTSGLLMVARNIVSYNALNRAMLNRNIVRQYIAVVKGQPFQNGTISAPIGRHRNHRTMMAVTCKGKAATTHYQVIKRYQAHTLVKITLETGRTHQIRVHFAYKKHPVVGDPIYGKKEQCAAGISDTLQNIVSAFPHQALHAESLACEHPKTRAAMQWQAPLPHSIQQLIEALSKESDFLQET